MATDQIEEALRAEVQARGEDCADHAEIGQGLLTQWVAVSAWQRIDEDGDPVDGVVLHTPGDNMPRWQLRGLLAEALRIIDAGED